jgi:hypothetical protein
MSFSNNKLLNKLALATLDEINEEGINEGPRKTITDWKSLKAYTGPKLKPNDRCGCNSGLKFKKCCKKIDLNNTKLKEVESEYISMINTAGKLYNKCVEEKLKLLNPTEYLDKQEINRDFFKKLQNKINNLSIEEIETIKNTSTYKYISFMYNNYPDGFGNYLFNAKLKKEKIDILETYYNFKILV